MICQNTQFHIPENVLADIYFSHRDKKLLKDVIPSFLSLHTVCYDTDPIKTPHSKVLLILRVYSLQQERIQRAVA
jgi:hypothetical protein